ncbi:MAG: cobyrinic acid a,c-diamide synthase, partial [Dehalococcoidia bacterium]|nr:cobyrinic acid a,c-diamide synthase [Dehalococcoidia bacterium]
LGLIPTVEHPASEGFLERLVAQCEATFDIAGILRLSEKAVTPEAQARLFPPVQQTPVTRIAVAKDRAFSFYYQDSLDLLEAWGAELVYFSPMSDSSLSAHVSGLYIGGGFPELYAAELAANDTMKKSMKTAAGEGMPVYAECGGLMYLGESIRDLEGKEFPMVGVLPVGSRIDTPRLNLGYRTVEALSDGPLLCRGETVRGHEFHWSVLSSDCTGMNAYRVTGSQHREGFHIGSTFASYIHLHMASQPGMVRRFIEQCRRYGEKVSDNVTSSARRQDRKEAP